MVSFQRNWEAFSYQRGTPVQIKEGLRTRAQTIGLIPEAVVGESVALVQKREFKLPWREAGPPNHHDDNADSDQ